jgi:uncharacterized membrane protein
MQGTEPLEPFLKGVWTRSWQLFQANAITFILASLLVTVLCVVSLGILIGPLSIGYIELVRKAGRGEPIAVGDVFRGFDFFLPGVLATLLIGLAFLVGCLLLVLPGIAVAFLSAFTLHAIAFENLGVIAAITRSVKLVMDNLVNVLILMFAAAVVHAIGGSVLLGMLITSPFVMIAFTAAYERLTSPPAPPAVITTTGEAIPL